MYSISNSCTEGNFGSIPQESSVDSRSTQCWPDLGARKPLQEEGKFQGTSGSHAGRVSSRGLKKVQVLDVGNKRTPRCPRACTR